MQFSNSLHLGRVGSFRDSDVRAFAAASGATDLGGLNDLVKYVKAQSLWNNFRIYPMKSAQNAGSGPTVYGLGGLTANNATLVSSPTWGASGISFTSASSQYAAISDFLGTETMMVFHRTNATDEATNIAVLISKAETGLNQRSWSFFQNGTTAGDPLILLRSMDGTAANAEQYSAGKTGLGSDNCFVAQWVASGGRSLWLNKVSQTLTLAAGSANTSVNDSGQDIRINCQFSSGAVQFPANQTAAASAFLTGSITTTQRETITDLINAL